MTSRGVLTSSLLGVSVLAGGALSLGVGRPPRQESEALQALRAEATADPGRRLFGQRQCVVCHGREGEGGTMGPALGPVVPEYLRDAGGNRAAAKARLVRYLKEPKKVPTLRKDPSRYPNPMPGAESLGLDDAKLDQVAEYVLSLQTRALPTGGAGQGR